MILSSSGAHLARYREPLTQTADPAVSSPPSAFRAKDVKDLAIEQSPAPGAAAAVPDDPAIMGVSQPCSELLDLGDRC